MSLLSAALWIKALLSGPLATAVAIVAVTLLAALLISGRVPSRRAAEVLVGIFVVFGAATVADGIVGGSSEKPQPSVLPSEPIAVLVRPPAAAAYDPYAGASVPTMRTSSDLTKP